PPRGPRALHSFPTRRSSDLRRRCLLEEDREIIAVLHRDGLPSGNLELDLQAERPDVPVARPPRVRDRNREVIELDHEMTSLRDLDRKSTRLNSSHLGISYAV